MTITEMDPLSITGSTLLYPVIGYPVGQVKAPMLFNKVFAASGIDAACVPMEIAPVDLTRVGPALFAVRNVRGAMVTIPHKPTCVDFLDEASPAVRAAGACNAIVKRADGSLFGELFDGVGFVRGLKRAGIDPAGMRCLVVGSGGVGAAIAVALADASAAALGINDVNSVSAARLAERLPAYTACREAFVATNDPQGFDLVVNATPLGLNETDPLPVPVERLASATVVADVVMKTDFTPLLRAAQARGCTIHMGREMFIEMAPLYLSLFGYDGYTSEGIRKLIGYKD
ncbi:shikimate dehydrogenase family protein [Aromatoleum diolicum]|nr:shikimate dehydrogenase [Aromatoleum diolicum]